MSRFCVSSHPITGRSWRHGHPFRPRTGRVRRVIMVLLLLTFGSIIFGYNYVTDANRVRDMAESYLSQIIGGRVVVHSATLSIFEGLRLEGVRVYVDDGRAPDSLLFTAQSFSLKYDVGKIIRGQLEVGEIIAQKPDVHLTENVATHEWNFYRLGKNREHKIEPTSEQPSAVPALPDVLLRNARVEINEVRDGKLHAIGYEMMDGHLSPSIEQGSFNFQVQTRGVEGVGPWATGTAAVGTGKVDVQLHDFDFNRDFLSMSPANVREFSVRHEMSARISVLSLHYQPGPRPADKPSFVLEMKLNDVNFSAQQEDYLTAADVARRTSLRQSLVLMRPFYRVGGYAGGMVQREKGSGAETEKPKELSASKIASIVSTLIARANAGAGAPLVAAVGFSPPRAAAPPSTSSPSSPAEAVAILTETAPIELHEGSGTFIFNDDGVQLKDVTGNVEGNSFLINGHMVGYRPDAPFTFNIRSVDHKTLTIPETPRYFNSLPPLVRDIYSIVHPDGQCTMDMHIDRPTPGSRLFVGGTVDVVDGKFACIFFPYTLREAHGQVSFGYDEKAKADFVQITGVRGRGLPDGPNRDSYIEVNGEVGPLGSEWPDPQIVIRVKANNVYSEPALIRALPPEVRQPLKIFDADNTGKFPSFHGDFSTTVLHRAGWAWRWSFDTDLSLDDAAGKLVGFPYPIDHMAADVHVRDGYVDIVNARMKRGDASLRVDGRVSWGPMTPPDAPHVEPKIETDLRVSVRNLPIDKDLLSAMPPDQALWLKRVGIGGKLDVDGRVFQGIADPNQPSRPVDPDNVNFDLAIGLHDGTLWPADGTFSLSELSSKVHLTHDAIELTDIRARRAGSTLTGEGAIYWGEGPVQLAMRINAKNLPMDAPLYSLLPKSGRQSWEQIQPQGTLDADMSWRGSFGEGEGSRDAETRGRGDPEIGRRGDAETGGRGDAEMGKRAEASIDGTNPLGARLATTSPAAPDSISASPRPHVPASPLPALFSRVPEGFNATLKPQAMSCTLKALPYRLEGVGGTITITPAKITLDDVSATHGAARLNVSGTGGMGEISVWNLKLGGKDLTVDNDFRKAMPPALVSMLNSVKFQGKVDFDFPKFVYTDREPAAQDAAAKSAVVASPAIDKAAAKPPAAGQIKPLPVDIDMEGGITLKGCSLEAGAPMKDVFGQITLATAVRDGKLSALTGGVKVPRATIAGRDMTDISLQLTKPADRLELYVQKVHGVLAGGQVAGELSLAYPDEGASRYLLSLVLRNADVETLVQDADKDIKGELTASLSLEGTLDDSAPRRGRGDVIVTGKELYHLPLMLGLFQVTNLSLPIATPFKTGTARYSVQGPRISFERVELKSDTMLMLGTGHLDFKTKRVEMTFTTDTPGGLKVPFLNDLIKNARGELLKITIKGTIQEPKVAANPFGTITTTIDEVFKNDAKEK